MFESVSRIRETIYSYPSFESFPFTYYTSGRDIYYNPVNGAFRVDVWLIELTSGKGLAIYKMKDDVFLVGYKIENGVVVEDDKTLVEVLDILVGILNGNDTAEKLVRKNTHTVNGLSVLFDIPPDEVSSALNMAELKNELKDKPVAIFGDNVIVLSRTTFIKRYIGKDAVEVATKYGFIVNSPISAIANIVKEHMGVNLTFFIFEDASIICNNNTCRELPLSSNISLLLTRKLRKSKILDLTTRRPEEYANTELIIPGKIAIGKRRIYYLDENNNVLQEVHVSVNTGYSYLLVFDRKGFNGYGLLVKKRVKVFDKEKEAEKMETEKENYLEKTILGF